MPTTNRPPDDHDALYRRLQCHLDKMPVPFPATASGVELRILRHLYSPEEAELALCLGAIPERLAVVHRRYARLRRGAEPGTGPERSKVEQSLDSMAERGLLQRLAVSGRVLYGKTLFVVGFYEAQVNRLTAALQRDVETYADEAFGAAFHAARTPQMRTVPINESIANARVVGRYDDIRAYVGASDGPFAVMNCICQQGKDLLGEPCRQTEHREHCLMLGAAARSMAARGDARFITRDETLAFLDQADRDGLVVEPQNTQHPLFICCCCGCCCGVLTMAKKLPRPADFFATNYLAVVDAEACHGCGTCVDRCQMDALVVDGGPVVVKPERCIGCGLCVTTCPTDAILLQAKPETRVPPKDTGRLYARMYADRYGATALAAVVGRRMLGLKT